MPHLEITSDELIIRLNVWETLLSLRRQINIPLSEVRGATDDEGAKGVALGIRVLGTGVPGVLQAGTYRKDGSRQFVYVSRGQHPVVIELSNRKWDRIILGVKDARQEAIRINSVLASGPDPG